MKAEPAVVIGALSSLATAIIGLLVAFNVDVTEDQKNAILSTIGALVPVIFLTSALIRQFVFSPRTAKRLTDEAYNAGTPPTESKPVMPEPPAND